MTPIDRDEFVPGKLWSLWDLMQIFPFERFTQASMRAASYSAARNDPDVQQQRNISLQARSDLTYFLDDVDQCVAAAKLVETGPIARDLRSSLEHNDSLSPMEVYTTTSHVADLMISELSKGRFFLLQAFEAAAYEHPHFLGEDVWQAFPSARLDIGEMGSCYACGRYNAASYHAIQAAEIGLRTLARDRRVKPKFSKKPLPLDQAQWGDLLNALKKETAKVGGWTKGPVKDAAHKFYEPALLEANALNDGWRRHLAHARAHEFHRDEFEGLLGHVRRFLQRLATRIGEDKKLTPIIWRSASAGLAR